MDEVFAQADRHLVASRGRLRRVAEDGADLAVRVGCSVAGVLDRRLDEMAAADADYRLWFGDTHLQLMRPGFDRPLLMLQLGQHVSARAIEGAAPDVRTPRIEALLELHPHSLLVGQELLEMLSGDGRPPPRHVGEHCTRSRSPLCSLLVPR